MSPNYADGMANSEDPDQRCQTAPLGAVWSGFALFAQTCLSENLGKLRYTLVVTDEDIDVHTYRLFAVYKIRHFLDFLIYYRG